MGPWRDRARHAGAHALRRINWCSPGWGNWLATVAELGVGAPAWLPPRRPRVLAVEITDPTGSLRALHAGLTHELATTLGWQPPRERFRPHITLARMRPGAEQARELPPTPSLTFAPTALTLFRSDLDPDGAVYTPLASIPPT